jgi:putative peptidoglycan lipid II flippase
MKWTGIFHTDFADIHHAAFLLSIFSLFSALLGLMRDRLLAGIFGASLELDIYFAAFRVPDFIYTVLLLFAASTALIPLFLRYVNNEAEHYKKAEELFGSVLLFFAVLVTVLSVVAFVVMPFLMRVLFPSFVGGAQETIIFMSRVLLFSPFLLGLSNIFSGITQAYRRFFVYALSPVLYNVGIILGIFVFVPMYGVKGLVWGVAIGAFLHMGIQIPTIVALGITPKFSRIWSRDIREVLALSLPRTLGLGITQISLVIFTAIASTLSQGSIAVFTLASNLEYIPITLIGLSYSVAAFPKLAAYSLKKETEYFKEHFSLAFRHIIFWAVPFASLLLVLRAQVVRVILGSGEFSWTDTRLTAAVLFLLSIAVVFQSLFLLLVRAFYAEGESWRPLFINIVSTILAVGAVFWFVRMLEPGTVSVINISYLMRLSGIIDIRVIAIPAGIVIGSFINFLFLFVAFWKVFGWSPAQGAHRTIGEVLLGSGIGALSAYGALQTFSRLFDLQTFMGIFLQGFLAGVVGIAVIVMILWVLRNRELIELWASIHGRIWKDRVPPPEPERLL